MFIIVNFLASFWMTVKEGISVFQQAERWNQHWVRCNDLEFRTYTQQYKSCVCPVAEYTSFHFTLYFGIWEFCQNVNSFKHSSLQSYSMFSRSFWEHECCGNFTLTKRNESKSLLQYCYTLVMLRAWHTRQRLVHNVPTILHSVSLGPHNSLQLATFCSQVKVLVNQRVNTVQWH